MNKKYVGLFLSAVACVPAIAAADGAAPAAPAAPSLSDVLVSTGITANGYVSASYNASLNSTNGATGSQIPLHQFDTNSNTFSLNQAALTLSYLPSSGFGALVNVVTGEDAKAINGAYANGSSDFALTQGYVQYAVGNLTVIGGRFVTLAGEEVIDDTKNANISRSLLFTNLEPLVHTGVRATYKVSDLLTVNGGFNNSALGGPSQDSNKFKTLEVNATITPNSATTIALTDYYGVDGNGATQTKNNYFDVVGSWQATPALLLAVNGDYVRSIGTLDTLPGAIGGPASGAAGTDTLAGLALYGSYSINDSWKASLRGEYVYAKGSPTASASGIGHVAELTATIDYAAAKSFDILGEFREDYGSVTAPGFDAGIFPSANNTTTGTQKSQTEFLVKAIYKFGTPVPSS
jgi:hypothetical protein